MAVVYIGVDLLQQFSMGSFIWSISCCSFLPPSSALFSFLILPSLSHYPRSAQAINSPLNFLLLTLKRVSPPLQPPHKPKANMCQHHTTQLAPANSSTSPHRHLICSYRTHPIIVVNFISLILPFLVSNVVSTCNYCMRDD